MAAELPTVFLCDDVPEVRALLRFGLEETGELRVIGEADEPVSGVEQAAELQPDAVILDLSMPLMDGLTALPKFRKVAPRAKIVIFSGFLEDSQHTQAGDGEGADAYMSKDAPLDRLRSRILELLEGETGETG